MANRFNYRASSEHLYIQAQSKYLVSQMLATRIRQPNAEERTALEQWMAVAIAGLQASDLYESWDIQIPRNKNHYYGKTRRSPMYQPELLHCFDWLIDNDFLVLTKKHSHNTSRKIAIPASYRITQKWIEMAKLFPPPPPGTIVRNRLSPFVELRDELKRVVTGVDHPNLQLWKKRLSDYDDQLRHHVFEYGEVRLEPALFSLTRIFSQGRYDKGGRYFSAFQQWTAKQRSDLKIDGKSVMELDYKSLHPSLLYHKVGLPCPSDPYSLVGYDRSQVKKAFSILVNRHNPDDCWESFCFYLHMKKKPAMDLEASLRRLHRPIEQYFGSGIGLELQYFDSLLCEAVIDKMMENTGAIVVPVHDSFIVKDDCLEAISDALDYAENLVAKEMGNPPRHVFLLQSDALGPESFTNQELSSVFVPTQDSMKLESVQSKNSDELWDELFYEDAL